jgi:hypothetical protein
LRRFVPLDLAEVQRAEVRGLRTLADAFASSSLAAVIGLGEGESE